MLFVALWVTFVYFPMAHMVWYWGGPDIMAEAAKKRAATPSTLPAPTQACLFKWGALDFAGGTVVHINAGIAGLVGCAHRRQARRLRQGADGSALADA